MKQGSKYTHSIYLKQDDHITNLEREIALLLTKGGKPTLEKEERLIKKQVLLARLKGEV